MASANKALFAWTLALVILVGLLPANKMWLVIFLSIAALVFLCLWLVHDAGSTSTAYDIPLEECSDFEVIGLKA